MITVRIDRIATTYALGYCPDRPTPASEPTRHATVHYALVFTGDHYPADLDALAPAIHAANTNLNPINIDIHDIRKRTVANLPDTPLTPATIPAVEASITTQFRYDSIDRTTAHRLIHKRVLPALTTASPPPDTANPT